MLLLILFEHKVIVLLAHVVVGDAQYRSLPVRTHDGKHTVVKEQAGKYLRLDDVTGGKGGHQISNDLSLLGDTAQHALTVAVQAVQLDELLHLVIIRAGVGINHLFGRFASINVVLQVVENHVAVEHLGVAVQTVFGKAIVVVPRLHIGNHRFDVSIVLSGILIVLQHLTHVFFAES